MNTTMQPGTRIEWTADIFGDGADLITLTGTVLGPSTHYPTKTHVQCDDAVVSEHVDTDKIRAI